ncbi:hypothetical protein HBI56_094070 [Parastagonospora nodorum]|uniref:Uncharacterized protein n=1 Tax=Phaeosphaeria nodorum (strain SN15 / ATCC MYA-4574 / FGSC 10173) TaxID=321614 RepID=A0A7U2F476_PHANO|nr:hypothetical protein HBH56_089360 [Parastagonospora nodorum]QRC98136.1 hypothetical protein JI435_411580 [Parastagonospora nodorum SN15]KAH3936393.1 hypothetical protein HBH54_024000 [Parastagonospora nodorum]KAH3945825.1 hypothetical protein HBH53_141100 [Parastagonospora nodorum]KAH3966322.1 hypothetical protein HBH51_144270 [Parastagonospora nodorum]
MRHSARYYCDTDSSEESHSSSSRVILCGASYCTNVMRATGRYSRRVLRTRV